MNKQIRSKWITIFLARKLTGIVISQSYSICSNKRGKQYNYLPLELQDDTCGTDEWRHWVARGLISHQGLGELYDWLSESRLQLVRSYCRAGILEDKEEI